jgi:hypothetical protein
MDPFSQLCFFQPPSLENRPGGGPSRSQPPSPEGNPTSGPSHTGSGCYHYLPQPDLYDGPIDVTTADMPNLFDVLLSDIDEKVLHEEISTTMGAAYLSETSHLTKPHTAVDGIMFGRHKRLLFSLVVRSPRKPHSYIIHFLYESGSPFTCLSKEVCRVTSLKTNNVF